MLQGLPHSTWTHKGLLENVVFFVCGLVHNAIRVDGFQYVQQGKDHVDTFLLASSIPILDNVVTSPHLAIVCHLLVIHLKTYHQFLASTFTFLTTFGPSVSPNHKALCIGPLHSCLFPPHICLVSQIVMVNLPILCNWHLTQKGMRWLWVVQEMVPNTGFVAHNPRDETPSFMFYLTENWLGNPFLGVLDP